MSTGGLQYLAPCSRFHGTPLCFPFFLHLPKTSLASHCLCFFSPSIMSCNVEMVLHMCFGRSGKGRSQPSLASQADSHYLCFFPTIMSCNEQCPSCFFKSMDWVMSFSLPPTTKNRFIQVSRSFPPHLRLGFHHYNTLIKPLFPFPLFHVLCIELRKKMTRVVVVWALVGWQISRFFLINFEICFLEIITEEKILG
jgi:hypothetical protein